MHSTVGLGLAANAQHRTDAATGKWVATGKGSNRVHTNAAGYTISKTRSGGLRAGDRVLVAPQLNGMWTVTAPDGTVTTRSAHNLAWAKFEADQHANL